MTPKQAANRVIKTYKSFAKAKATLRGAISHLEFTQDQWAELPERLAEAKIKVGQGQVEWKEAEDALTKPLWKYAQNRGKYTSPVAIRASQAKYNLDAAQREFETLSANKAMGEKRFLDNAQFELDNARNALDLAWENLRLALTLLRLATKLSERSIADWLKEAEKLTAKPNKELPETITIETQHVRENGEWIVTGKALHKAISPIPVSQRNKTGIVLFDYAFPADVLAELGSVFARDILVISPKTQHESVAFRNVLSIAAWDTDSNVPFSKTIVNPVSYNQFVVRVISEVVQ